MEPDMNYGKIFCCGNPETKKVVVPVDCSIILPDYFPDVMKILRYTAKTVKSPVLSEGGTEKVSGNINVEVNYVSEEGELCSCSQLQPFGCSFDCEENVAAEAEISVGEIGCRAINKRRIDIHGNIDIVLKTLCGEEKSFVSSVKGEETVSKNKNIETVSMVGDFFKSFTVEEKGETGYGRPAVGKILRSSVFAEVSECHVIQDKIVTKGEIKVTVLWVPEENEENEKGPFVSVFSYPVSRMVDAEGILLTDICDAKYEAEFPEVYPSEDGQGINIKVKVGIFSRVYRKERLDFVEDMFSTDFESRTEKVMMNVIETAVPVLAAETVFEKFDLPETVERISDIWIETEKVGIDENGKIILSAKLCMFAEDCDKSPVFFEKNIEKVIASPAEGKQIVFSNISAGVKSCEFSSGNDGKAEISASVLIDGTIYTALSTEMVTNYFFNKEKKVEHGDSAMILCFAEKGDKIWDIAKKYRVSAENIMKENNISEEILSEKTMIVIA